MHKDHLGSIDVITGRGGQLLQTLSFDAWGQRRNADSWENLIQNLSQSQLGQFSTVTTRGYTGHEMLDQVGLIHMNGRIYDPRLARFLQADPFVQEPGYSQSHNRYAYVWNNPLNATDPSGYFRLRQWVGVIVAVVGGIICGPSCAQFGWQVVALGAVSGAAGAAANGGNILEGAFMGAVSAAAFAGIGSHLSANYGTATGGLNATGYGLKIAAHGFTGGVMAVLQGGKFGHGFAAAGFTAAGTSFNNSSHIGGEGYSVTRVVVAAVIGGTASKLSGGKFANGAITGAFSQAFNNEQAEERAVKERESWKAMVEEFKSSIQEAYEMGESGDINGYIAKVRERGDWDFKNRIEYRNLRGVEEFGNYAFGATSQAWADGFTRGVSAEFSSISIDLSMRGAGYYQQYYQSKNYSPSDGTAFDYNGYPGSTNYGDNWRDQGHIWMGAKYYYRIRASK